MKQLKSVVVMFMTLIGLVSAVWAQDMSAQYYAAGNTYYAQKNYDLAIRYYQGAVQTNPNSWQAYQGMGNCYYGKGDSANALTNYQKALAINPNNPQLASFVQSLQASAPAPAVASSPATSNSTASSPAVSGMAGIASPKMFEVEPMIGVAVGSSVAASNSAGSTSISYGTGFGGGVGGYYLLDSHLAIGAIFGFYTFSGTAYGGPITITPYYYTVTTTPNLTSIEILPSVKYTFDGNTIRPYLLGGLGLSMLSVSSSTKFDPGNLPPAYVAEVQAELNGQTTTSVTDTDPMVSIGAGGEYLMGKDMSLFLQAKYTMIFDGGKNGAGGFTLSYIPVNAGLNIEF